MSTIFLVFGIIFGYIFTACLIGSCIFKLEERKVIKLDNDGEVVAVGIGVLFWPIAIVLVPVIYVGYKLAVLISEKIANGIEWIYKEKTNPRENV